MWLLDIVPNPELLRARVLLRLAYLFSRHRLGERPPFVWFQKLLEKQRKGCLVALEEKKLEL